MKRSIPASARCFEWGLRQHSLSAGRAAALALLAAGSALAQAGFLEQVASPVRMHGLSPLGAGFVANEGQWPERVRFALRRGSLSATAEATGIWIESIGRGTSEDSCVRTALHLGFEESAPQVLVQGEGAATRVHHFLLGRDPVGWRQAVASHESIRWRDVRPGVDVVLSPGRGAELLAYALECAPGTGPRPLVLALSGQDELALAADGSLIARTSAGELRQSAPLAWEQLAGGGRVELAAEFVLLGGGRFAIEARGRDDSRPLWIDPGIEWAGYVGGQSYEELRGLALSSSEEPVVVGVTQSVDFPTTPGVFQEVSPPGRDAFAMKVSADGSTLLFSTFLGGSDWDDGFSVVMSAGDRPVLAGRTKSGDFPITAGALDGQFQTQEGFVSCLRSDGSALVFSTYLGGSEADWILEIERRSDGVLVLGGGTMSLDFPGVAGGVQSSKVGADSDDAFVALVAGDGKSLLQATYLGGRLQDVTTDLIVDQDQSIVAVGITSSSDFPVTPGAYDTSLSNQTAAFIARLSPDLTQLQSSTLLDGSYGHTAARAVAILGDGAIAVAGFSFIPDFPTTPGSPVPTIPGITAGFVTIFDSAGTSILLSSFLDEGPSEVADLLATGNVLTMVGQTGSPTFPATPGCFDPTATVFDAFVLRLEPGQPTPLYATTLDPIFLAATIECELDSSGRAIVIGNVNFDSFPVTPGSFDSTYGGGTSSGFDEGFLALVELQPLGVTAFGAATEGCHGPVWLTALHEPKWGNPAFALGCTGAPPLAPGVLAVAAGSDLAGLPLLGVGVHLDVQMLLTVLPLSANALGYAEAALPLPPGSGSKTAYAQALWYDLSASCPPAPAWSASDALSITLAP